MLGNGTALRDVNKTSHHRRHLTTRDVSTHIEALFQGVPEAILWLEYIFFRYHHLLSPSNKIDIGFYLQDNPAIRLYIPIRMMPENWLEETFPILNSSVPLQRQYLRPEIHRRPHIFFEIGDLYLDRSNPRRALLWYRMPPCVAILYQPLDHWRAPLVTNMGTAYEAVQNFQAAEFYLQQGVSLQYLPAYEQLAHLYQRASYKEHNVSRKNLLASHVIELYGYAISQGSMLARHRLGHFIKAVNGESADSPVLSFSPRVIAESLPDSFGIIYAPKPQHAALPRCISGSPQPPATGSSTPIAH